MENNKEECCGGSKDPDWDMLRKVLEPEQMKMMKDLHAKLQEMMIAEIEREQNEQSDTAEGT